MALPEDASRLRIYINESDRRAGPSLYQWVLVKAREHGLAAGPRPCGERPASAATA